MSKQSIILDKITKQYDGRTVISDFCADITENTAIMGASGEGKTTLARIIMGLEYADSGKVIFSEKPTFSCVFQEDRLFEDFTAIENVALAYGKEASRADIKKQAMALLSAMNIEESEQKKPVSSFSGGMKRRTALARAIAKSSDILVLDEPFKGLDPGTREVCAAFIREKTKERLILLITHDKTEASLLGIQQIIYV